MAVTDIDFEGTGNQGGATLPVDNPSGDSQQTVTNSDTTNLGGDEADDITNKPAESGDTAGETKPAEDTNTSATGELTAGDTIDVDGTIYTVAENGDLVDDKGNVFKEAKDVQNWLASVEVEDENANSPITLSSIQEALGVTITDEDGKNVTFTDDADGVKAYVDSVIAVKSQELQEAAINRLYQDNPLLKQFQDYVQLNGTPKGFGEIPDRSGIRLDKDNEQQLVAVIKMAAQEFGNKSLNDNYIKYLRDSGGLYDEARNQLQALVEKDTEYKKQIETKAQEQRDAQAKATADYWNNVNRIVESRQIGSYRIPESFTKEVDGKKIIITSKDFFNYLSTPKEVDGRIATGYQHDLAKLTDEEYMNREILDAWLMFTGGTYKDLIDMAVKEEQVRQLRVKSKDRRATKSVKVVKHNAGKSSIDDIIL
jgi:hypothetical protein